MIHLNNILKSKAFLFVTFLLVVLGGWRIYLGMSSVLGTDSNMQVWAASYQIIAWCGAIIGLIYSRVWGGYKSVIGRASLAFSVGLLMQSFGQSVFSYYFYTGNPLPYPSLADLGFFGSIPCYIYGVMEILRASGARFSLSSLSAKLQAIFIPLFILGVSYIVFLKDYQFDSTQPFLKTFLDFGYPLGQAVYISIAILAYIISQNMMGGIMRKAIIFFILALGAQYLSDYTFLYQSLHGTFVGGGLVDCMYMTSYFLMAISLIQLQVVFEQIQNRE